MAARADQVISDGIQVIVNDAIITYQDVRRMAGPAMELLSAQFRNQPQVLDQRRTAVLADATDQLIERQLILDEYKTAGYSFPETIIEDTIDDRIRQQYRDRVTLMQSLREAGTTFESYRKRTREDIIIQAMRQKNLTTDILISPQKIVTYYEQNKTNYAVGEQAKLRMIVLNKQSSDTGSARQLADEIERKLKEGASFREMAKIYSDGPQRANEGDWGWAERSVLRKELADEAFKLKKGERSGVIELNDSCWLVLVEDKREAHTRPLNEVRDDIERILRQRENERQRQKWIGRLKDKAFVRYF
jgi:peptidyl-prolyl cis-trans isomerase SurA